MFTVERRAEVRDELVRRARADEHVVGAAHTGSAARGAEDRWSDIDVFLGIRGSLTEVMADWTAWLYADLGAIHHFDLSAGLATYRAFLLRDGLEIDLGFAPEASFGPLGDGAFELVFGQPAPRSAAGPDVGHLVGLTWHHALHPRVAIEREQPWLAEHWISALRNHVIALACIRQDLPSSYAKGADRLPDADRQALSEGIVRSLDRAELNRAHAAVVRTALEELRPIDPVLADQLSRTL